MTETISRFPGFGIPRTLARARSACIADIVYRLSLELPEDAAVPIRGRVRIAFGLPAAQALPAIDFAPFEDDARSAAAIDELLLDGETAAFRLSEGHLLVDAAAAAGRHSVEISFTAGTAGLRRRKGLVYTLFVPAFAHRVFPCFDQPDLRARLELALELPSGWTAHANAPTQATQDDGSKPARRKLRFAPTEPLPTYLFAFAAGRLDEARLAIGEREFSLAWPAGGSEPAAGELAAIAELHASALETLEEYTGVDYPFAKIGAVLIPDFDFGGMEHPGAVFYRRELVCLPREAGASERLRRAALIAHETAHMWFGNLVTIRWFDDVWLKEVFANFMADRIVAEHFPAVDHALVFALRHYPPAYAIDRSAGTHPIRQSLENLADAGELYDALVYHKAPIAISALEAEIGERALRRALARYLDRFSFASADWPALIACLGRETRKDLGSFSRRWIEAAGPPPVSGAYDPEAGPVYGRRRLEPSERAHALEALRRGKKALARAAAWLALYEDMLEGGIEAAALLTAALETLASESDALFTARLIEDLSEIYWRFLDAARRGVAAGAVERALRVRLDTASERQLWLERLARFALTPETLAELESIWRGETDGFAELGERISLRLALVLALRRPAHAEAIIARQIERISDPDRRERFRFLAPAVAPDAAVRSAKFAALARGEGRELWSVAALRLLCDPLRAEDALTYLEPGLKAAAGLRRRGDIFLPRQWLEALLFGHGTSQAAATIEAFLDSADHPPRFTALVRQTADPVFRAARIRDAYS